MKAAPIVTGLATASAVVLALSAPTALAGRTPTPPREGGEIRRLASRPLSATIDAFTEAAQVSTGIPGGISSCSQGTLASPPPWSILGSQRDLLVESPGHSLAPLTAAVGPPILTFYGSPGVGTARVVWDGVDDCATLSTATPLGDFGALGSELTVMASNPGTASAFIRFRLYGPGGYLESPRQLVPSGMIDVPFFFPFASFVPNGPAWVSDVRAVELLIDNSGGFGPGALVQIQSVEITGLPVPVTLMRFEAE